MSMFAVAMPHAPSISLSETESETTALVMVRAVLPSGESDVLEAMVRTALPSGEAEVVETTGESDTDVEPPEDLDLGAAPHFFCTSTWKYPTGSFTVPGTRFQSCGERKRGS
jgi:hypothetical protein